MAGDQSIDRSSSALSLRAGNAASAAAGRVVSLFQSYGVPLKAGLGLGGLSTLALAVYLGFGGLGDWIPSSNAQAKPTHMTSTDLLKQAKKKAAEVIRPTDAQWQAIGFDDVKPARFVESIGTDGKIAIDEDHTTPVFSPYAGRVVKLMVKAGDKVEVGTPLFTIDAADMVQAQNDFVSTTAGLNKARSALQLAEKTHARSKTLVESKAAALKELQAAEDGLTAARNDLRSAEAALQAARNRLTILGKTTADIETLTTAGRISAETTVYAPIAGTIVQRKVGPGQFLAAGASDPAFIIGDLSNVWLVANVRETDTPKVRVGQPLEFTTLAIPDHVFEAKISYVATSVDPATRRLMVRASVPNPKALLKPEMFANVSIITRVSDEAVSCPRSALISEGSEVRVWVALPDKSIELRKIEVGLTNADRVQVVRGLGSGDRVVAPGNMPLDRSVAKVKH